MNSEEDVVENTKVEKSNEFLLLTIALKDSTICGGNSRPFE